MLFAIIVAAGKGSRLGTEIPKQFLLLNNKPVLEYSIDSFIAFDQEIKIIVILADEYYDAWSKYLIKYKQVICALGGSERYISVQNGVKLLHSYDANADDVVMIHDAARPFLELGLIFNLYQESKKKGNASPFTVPKSSVRQLKIDGGNKHINRNEIVIVQTPQCFQYQFVQSAYTSNTEIELTDDAALIEKQGIEINLIPGNEQLFKITTKLDLQLAEIIAKQWKNSKFEENNCNQL